MMDGKALLALALCLPVLLSACGKPAPEVGATRVFRHSEDGAPTSLDPLQSANAQSAMLVRNCYDTLYAYQYLARPYVLKPNLARALPEVSADGLTYVIRLKPGVRFIDDAAFTGGRGRDVTAADVVYSLKRHFDPDARSQGAWLWQQRIAGLDAWKARGAHYDEAVEGLRARDAQTLEVKLLRPYPQFVHTLTLAFSAVVPREAVERYGRGFGRHPVGSGPFKLLSLDSARAVLTRNAGFRAEPLNLRDEGYDPVLHAAYGIGALQGRSPPLVDRIEIDWIAEPMTRWNSFIKRDEIQTTVLPPERYDEVLASRQPVALRPEYAQRYHSAVSVDDGLGMMAFNFRDPALGGGDDEPSKARAHALRCALVKGFDWQARNQRFYGGIARVFSGVLTPAMPEFDGDLAPPQRDLDGARRLLAQAGYTPASLPTLQETAMSAVIYREMHEQFAGFLRDLGWPASRIGLRSVASFGDFDRATKTGQAQLFLQHWELDYPDAQNTLQLFYRPNAAPGANTSNYANAEFDRLFEEAEPLPPGPPRTDLYRRMNRLLVDDCAGIFAMARTRVNLWQRSVIALPDREIGNGFWLRYVALQ